MAAVAFATMMLVVVLSVFNGLEDFVRSLYNAFDPDIKIEATVGKSFQVDDQFFSKINNIKGVEVVTEVVEDNAYARYRDSEEIIKLKGVGPNFLEQGRMSKTIVYGEPKLLENGVPYAIIGQGVQFKLSIDPSNELHAMQIYYPKRGRIVSYDPSTLVNQRNILPNAVFSIEKQYDVNYVFVPLDFALDLMNYGDRRTALEIMVNDEASVASVKGQLQEMLGSKFTVLDSDEQHSSLLKVLKIEKLFVFLVFSFILAVSSFNIFFSLTMLAIEKKRDISILYSMGADNKFIRNIFIKEGAIISFIGAIVGLLTGFLVVVVQKAFGIVSMGMSTSVVDAYPVKMVATDFLYTAIAIVIITILASIRPATIATRYNNWQNL
jgi:lipoprotein-releasing system permease protein